MSELIYRKLQYLISSNMLSLSLSLISYKNRKYFISLVNLSICAYDFVIIEFPSSTFFQTHSFNGLFVYCLMSEKKYIFSYYLNYSCECMTLLFLVTIIFSIKMRKSARFHGDNCLIYISIFFIWLNSTTLTF